MISTYQAGQVVVVREEGGSLQLDAASFPRAMGIAVDDGRLAIAEQSRIWTFDEAAGLVPATDATVIPDARYVAGATHETGDIKVHEIHYGDEGLWVVNTRFSCLGTLDDERGFVPRWHPDFVTALAPEDRCHLNGLAMVDGRPKYVTVLGRADRAEGWRDRKADGGCVLDVETSEVVCTGLAMPHSPRWHEERLWVLDSGRGLLCIVDRDRGRADSVIELPGFARGLDLVGPYAFVGLSHARERAWFGGLPITEEGHRKNCGVWVVDTRGPAVVGVLRLEDAVEEIFEVKALPGARLQPRSATA